MVGEISMTEFSRRLAQEWASLPVLAATKGAYMTLARGQSYYTGDPLNKALVSPERVEAVFDQTLKFKGQSVPLPAESNDHWFVILMRAIASLFNWVK